MSSSGERPVVSWLRHFIGTARLPNIACPLCFPERFLASIALRTDVVIANIDRPLRCATLCALGYGPKRVSRAVLKWVAQNGLDIALSDSGTPRQSDADESFKGKFRDECLSPEWFRTRVETKVVIER